MRKIYKDDTIQYPKKPCSSVVFALTLNKGVPNARTQCYVWYNYGLAFNAVRHALGLPAETIPKVR